MKDDYSYILLTECEGRTGRISARGLGSGEVRTRKTEGRYSPSTARANSVNKRFIARLLVSEKTRTAHATSIQRVKIAKIKLIVFVGFLLQL